MAVSGQVREECLDLLFTGSKVVPGLHVVETDIAFDPIPVGAFGMDGIMASPHEVAHFVKQSGRHKKSPRVGSCVELGGSRRRALPGDDIAHGRSA